MFRIPRYDDIVSDVGTNADRIDGSLHNSLDREWRVSQDFNPYVRATVHIAIAAINSQTERKSTHGYRRQMMIEQTDDANTDTQNAWDERTAILHISDRPHRCAGARG